MSPMLNVMSLISTTSAANEPHTVVTRAPLSLTWALIHTDRSYTGALQPKSSIIQHVFRVTASFHSEIPSEESVNARIVPVWFLLKCFPLHRAEVVLGNIIKKKGWRYEAHFNRVWSGFIYFLPHSAAQPRITSLLWPIMRLCNVCAVNWNRKVPAHNTQD